MPEVATAGGAITAAGFRDRSGIGRNAAIEVLEYFDRIRFTRRIGDTHVLVRAAGAPFGLAGPLPGVAAALA